MSTPQLTRAHQLLELRRYEDAERLVRDALAGNPHDAHAHALLAFVLHRRKQPDAALAEACEAIRLAPAEAEHHYILALIHLARNDDALAEQTIREALRLDPRDPRYYAVLARIHTWRKAWHKALEAAEAGLRHDPHHVECLNLRATAQLHTGKQAEAQATFRAALAQAPDEAYTHANQGWALLHAGSHHEAFAHFREALRLDPLSQWAREGVVEALRARNPLYRLLLRYFLWMAGLTTGERWGVWIALSTGMQTLRALARAFFPLWLLVLPLEFFYALFIGLTWTARPLFALLVRCDKLGRHALPHEEIVASNWVLVCLITSLLGLLLAPLTGNLAWLLLPLVGLALILPVSGVFHADKGPVRWVLIVYTLLLALCGLAMTTAAATRAPLGVGLAVGLAVAFITGTSAYPMIAILLLLFSRMARDVKAAMRR